MDGLSLKDDKLTRKLCSSRSKNALKLKFMATVGIYHVLETIKAGYLIPKATRRLVQQILILHFTENSFCFID